MAEFATLTDVKQHLNLTSTAHDDELELMLEAAEDVVRSLVGSLAAATVTERVTVVGGTAILSGRPTGAVTVNGGDLSGFTVNARAGLLYDLPGSSPVTVTYSTGGDVPASVTLATAIIAGHLWETQRGTSPSALTLQQVDDPSSPFVGAAGYAIPNRAKELLQPYARVASQVA